MCEGDRCGVLAGSESESERCAFCFREETGGVTGLLPSPACGASSSLLESGDEGEDEDREGAGDDSAEGDGRVSCFFKDAFMTGVRFNPSSDEGEESEESDDDEDDDARRRRLRFL